MLIHRCLAVQLCILERFDDLSSFLFLKQVRCKAVFFFLFEKKHIAVFRVVDLWIWYIALLRLCYI